MLPTGSVMLVLMVIALWLFRAVMNKAIFGKVLRDLRVDRNLTQEKLAELADFDRTYIYRLEKGKREPSLSTILKLSDALKVSPGEFFDRVNNLRK